MAQRGASQKVGEGTETADRETFALGLFHRFKIGLRVKLKRHQVTDAPKIFYIEPGAPSADGFHESAPHDLNVSSNQCLKISRAGIEENQEHIQPLVFKETSIFGDVNR